MSSSNDSTQPGELNVSTIEKMFSEEEAPETLLDEDKDKAPISDEEDKEESEEDKEDELEPELLKELEDLDDEVDEEDKIDEDEIVDIPRRKDILKAYPDIFKKFPFLQKAFYKVSEYDQIFPSLDDAKGAVIRATALSNIEQVVHKGEIGQLFEGIKKSDPEGFNRCVDNLLTGLHKADSVAYGVVLRNIMANVIQGLENDGKELDNDVLTNTAKVLKDVIFNGKNPERTKLGREEKTDPEAERLNQERQQYNQQRFDTALQDVTESVDNTLQATIESVIDPKGSMSSYVKKNAVKDALDYLKTDLGKSGNLKPIINRLWENAHNNNYSKDSLNKIKNALKARAKTLLPTAIKRARAEAFKDSRKSNQSDGNTVVKSGKVTAPPTQKGRNEKSDPLRKANGKRMTTEEFFNS